MQCDKLTGHCICKKGITGYHCDRCDRGTYGQIPECRQCGECFDNWSGILGKIKSELILNKGPSLLFLANCNLIFFSQAELDQLENQATNIAVSSAASVNGFSEQYAVLEGKLNDIRKLLSTNYTDRQVKQLQDSLNHIE